MEDETSRPIVPLLAYLTGIGLFFLVVVLLGVIGVVAVLDDDPSGGGTGDSAQSTTLDVSLSEFSIDGDLTAPAGDVDLDIVNEGSADHNLIVRGTDIRTEDISSGGTDTLALGTLPPGEFELYCDIEGHEASGMVNTLTIAESGSEVAAGSDGGSEGDGGEEQDWAALDAAMTESMLAFPAETEGKGNPPLEPTILEDGTKQFEITAEITPWEVSPGEIVDAWTYNGVVPGPSIQVDVGDNVQVIVNNELPMGTDVHWHGVHTPNDQDGVAPYTQDLIEAGTTYTYEFVAEDPAIGMYHAHHHAQMQVINGMFATFQIGDSPYPKGQTVSGVTIPEDLEVAEEIPMVLNDAGVIGFSLNGKSFPATEPLALETGDWGAIHYYNEGLTDHPMHLHQFPQLVYAKDGIPLDHPYWADTINVAPGERYSVLFHAEDPGTWVWHCHILTHVERDEGMFGMVTAVVVA
jgi:FtsP/CotA-like multicopper oxidase with cupredoxin domain